MGNESSHPHDDMLVVSSSFLKFHVLSFSFHKCFLFLNKKSNKIDHAFHLSKF